MHHRGFDDSCGLECVENGHDSDKFSLLCSGSAVTYVAIGVVSDIEIERRFRLWAVTRGKALRCGVAQT
ncbi:hypothetical protein CVE34_22495 [Pseudomonas syringae pv. actinidiae]|uniref:Uncharacterized protein n=2 Tax=Pseudomonas syringae group TaxID=136849 RepID=A0A261WAB6_9PSED|nr:hypothetical protein B1R35_15185 [Pseudomonas syringae pv. actinidiae]AYL81481.1 hypothetical protein CN228_17465 [Pseudomonas syringae pv. actinidiae str. Shaanxi_M228]OZI82853.1 hypothetical protein CFN58_35460 [Pseudomonas avellanae]AQX66147.1 hypothetical protein B1F85_20750 [Pseudomonas syringae pv. actinidiae]ATV17744.1 hypothetical protein CT122_13320 [Pseudomonas syringae pv. actinidiae]